MGKSIKEHIIRLLNPLLAYCRYKQKKSSENKGCGFLNFCCYFLSHSGVSLLTTGDFTQRSCVTARKVGLQKCSQLGELVKTSANTSIT